MSDLSIRLKYTEKSGKEARVYFTSHPCDLPTHFETVVKDIFDSSESTVYYTKDMSAPFSDGDMELLLSEMQLFVVPVTLKLLTDANRAMEVDIPFAKRNGIPILPIMMEGGLDALYSAADKFGELQYVSRVATDVTAIPYKEKLSKFLDGIILSRESEELVRADFGSYVFLSYRKKDRSYAKRLMQRIHSDPALSDVAIWYDEFLTIGESFQKNIADALGKSRALLLLVTPSLLEDGNFVKTVEYPAARAAELPIIPVEMTQTDAEQLCKSYPELPTVIGFDSDKLISAIKSTLQRDISSEEWAAKHKYLMGLAYFYGIDMEVDRERGLDLVYAAARDDYYEAMMMLWNYYHQGVSAPELLKKSLALSIYLYREEHFGEEHPETLAALREIALVYMGEGDYGRAEELLGECYLARLRTLGKTHPDTIEALESIAWLHRNKGEREKSLEIFERVFAMQKDTLGIEHPATVSTVISLLGEYEYIEDYEKILELHKLIYRLKASRFGEGHHLTLNELNRLIVEYRSYARKNEAEAAELLNEADRLTERATELGEREYARLSRELGEGHPETLEQLMTLAESYSLLGDEERALSLYEKMRPNYAALYGEDSMQVSNLDFRIYNLTDGKDELEKISKMSIEELSAFLLDGLGDDPDLGAILFGDGDFDDTEGDGG